jgi:hypothetical protein
MATLPIINIKEKDPSWRPFNGHNGANLTMRRSSLKYTESEIDVSLDMTSHSSQYSFSIDHYEPSVQDEKSSCTPEKGVQE